MEVKVRLWSSGDGRKVRYGVMGMRTKRLGSYIHADPDFGRSMRPGFQSRGLKFLIPPSLSQLNVFSHISTVLRYQSPRSNKRLSPAFPYQVHTQYFRTTLTTPIPVL